MSKMCSVTLLCLVVGLHLLLSSSSVTSAPIRRTYQPLVSSNPFSFDQSFSYASGVPSGPLKRSRVLTRWSIEPVPSAAAATATITTTTQYPKLPVPMSYISPAIPPMYLVEYVHNDTTTITPPPRVQLDATPMALPSSSSSTTTTWPLNYSQIPSSYWIYPTVPTAYRTNPSTVPVYSPPAYPTHRTSAPTKPMRPQFDVRRDHSPVTKKAATNVEATLLVSGSSSNNNNNKTVVTVVLNTSLPQPATPTPPPTTGLNNRSVATGKPNTSAKGVRPTGTKAVAKKKKESPRRMSVEVRPEELFECASTKEMIPLYKCCNRVRDCTNGEDETALNCETNSFAITFALHEDSSWAVSTIISIGSIVFLVPLTLLIASVIYFGKHNRTAARNFEEFQMRQMEFQSRTMTFHDEDSDEWDTISSTPNLSMVVVDERAHTQASMRTISIEELKKTLLAELKASFALRGRLPTIEEDEEEIMAEQQQQQQVVVNVIDETNETNVAATAAPIEQTADGDFVPEEASAEVAADETAEAVSSPVSPKLTAKVNKAHVTKVHVKFEPEEIEAEKPKEEAVVVVEPSTSTPASPRRSPDLVSITSVGSNIGSNAAAATTTVAAVAETLPTPGSQSVSYVHVINYKVDVIEKV